MWERDGKTHTKIVLHHEELIFIHQVLLLEYGRWKNGWKKKYKICERKHDDKFIIKERKGAEKKTYKIYVEHIIFCHLSGFFFILLLFIEIGWMSFWDRKIMDMLVHVSCTCHVCNLWENSQMESWNFLNYCWKVIDDEISCHFWFFKYVLHAYWPSLTRNVERVDMLVGIWMVVVLNIAFLLAWLIFLVVDPSSTT